MKRHQVQKATKMSQQTRQIKLVNIILCNSGCWAYLLRNVTASHTNTYAHKKRADTFRTKDSLKTILLSALLDSKKHTHIFEWKQYSMEVNVTKLFVVFTFCSLGTRKWVLSYSKFKFPFFFFFLFSFTHDEVLF